MKPNPHPAILRLWREWIKPLLIGAVVILPLKSAVADWEWVPTGSMEPTIVPLEFVWVNKVAYDLKVPSPPGICRVGQPAAGGYRRFLFAGRRHPPRQARHRPARGRHRAPE